MKKARGPAIGGLLRVIACLPMPLVHALGAGLGWLLWRLPNTQRAVANRNLELCFPDRPPEDRRQLLRASLMETGKAILELGPLWLWPAMRVLERIESVDGETEWRRDASDGLGAIAITPHLGAWEVAGLYLSSHHRMTTLYRPSRLGLDPLVRRGRERLGATTVPTDRSGVRALYHTLRNGGVVGILPDQDAGAEGPFAPYFGVPASTITLVSRLAARQRCPVFLLVAERLARGRGYRLRYSRVPDGIGDPDLDHSLTVLNAAVEAEVRRLPHQYLWTYKRFKSRPPGVPSRY